MFRLFKPTGVVSMLAFRFPAAVSLLIIYFFAAHVSKLLHKHTSHCFSDFSDTKVRSDKKSDNWILAPIVIYSLDYLNFRL